MDFQSPDADRMAKTVGPSRGNFVQARAGDAQWTSSGDATDWMTRAPMSRREMRILATHGDAEFGAAICGRGGGAIGKAWVLPEFLSTAVNDVDRSLQGDDAMLFAFVMCEGLSIITKVTATSPLVRVGAIVLDEAQGFACLPQRTGEGKYVSEGTAQVLLILRAIQYGSCNRRASVATCLTRASARGGWGRLRFIGPAAIGNMPMCEFAECLEWLGDPAPDELFVEFAEYLASPARSGSLDPWIFGRDDIAGFDGGSFGRRTGRNRPIAAVGGPAKPLSYFGSGRDLFRDVAARLEIQPGMIEQVIRRSAAVPACVRRTQAQIFYTLSRLLRRTDTHICDYRVARALDALVAERGYEVIDALQRVLSAG
jgi:hypothetical protein